MNTPVPSRLEVVERLRSVIDPEVGLNIVDLGLIYDVQVSPEGTVAIKLTMTTPVCPMSSYIRQEVARVLQRMPGIQRGIIELVWEPPWSPYMIDPEVRRYRFPMYVRSY
ncbi:MAG: metal-sulfur cluster assembly factor [Rhodothermus sp.]|nr:metal-sulfur cluster assembly factor [Rhodothermus sp.]